MDYDSKGILVLNLKYEHAISFIIWSNLLSNATVNIIAIVRNCVRGGEANVYGSSYYWNFRTSSFKQVACLILCSKILQDTGEWNWPVIWWCIFSPFLKTGTMCASSQSFGTLPSSSDLLKRYVIAGVISSAISFKNLPLRHNILLASLASFFHFLLNFQYILYFQRTFVFQQCRVRTLVPC